MASIQNKTAIVSGANGNLGTAVVQELLHRNFEVTGCVRQSSKTYVTENYDEIAIDLLQEEEVQNKINQWLTSKNHISTAVLTAGGFAMGNLEKTSSEDILKQFRLNFLTAYHLTQPILRQMKRQNRGTIFLIGSLFGLDTKKGIHSVAYTLSKSLLFELERMINEEVREMDIKVFVVVPNTIDTPQNRTTMPNADFSKWQKPEDIAKLIADNAENYHTDKSVLIVAEELKMR